MTDPNSAPDTPQGLRGVLWGPLLSTTVPTSCIPALVTRWVLVPLLQERRARFDVCCRVRPLISREAGCGSSVSSAPKSPHTTDHEASPPSDAPTEPPGELHTPGLVTVRYNDSPLVQRFDFDSVVTGTDQALLFAAVRPYVERFVDRAEPGAVVAYGQTSAGKTHTILGDPISNGMEGTAVRGVRLILDRLSATSGDCGTEQRVLLANMYEVYLEEVRELTPTPADIGVGPSKDHEPVADGDRPGVDAFMTSGRWAPPCHRELAAAEAEPAPRMGLQKKTMRQCPQCREIYVQGSTPLYIDSTATFAAALESALRRRMIAQTSMGAMSSRSHFIVSLGIATVPSTKHERSVDRDVAAGARFDFVDCAGSERLAKTGATGQRLQEAMHINRSLSSLGNIVRAITAPSRHVPYRDSVLTRLLQRSAFADTARTLIVVCVSPADRYTEETVASLKFARMAQGPTRTCSRTVASEEYGGLF